MKYLLIKYSDGQEVERFETQGLKEAREHYRKEDESNSCSVRVFVNGEKLSYPKGDELMGYKERKKRGTWANGKASNKHIHG